MTKLGLREVEGIPCLFTNANLIVFFYVDDIVVLVHPRNLTFHAKFERQLLKIYDLRCLGDLRWFLGIRVIRRNPTGRIWLIQDSFINKLASKFNVTAKAGKWPTVPLLENVYAPSEEEYCPRRAYEFGAKVGSIGFSATCTRPDVARTHTVLARHLHNPGQRHLQAANHALRYLVGTRNLALSTSDDRTLAHYTGKNEEEDPLAGTEPLFFGASDAAFADDAETRRSSYGYLFKLGGMTIDWKASLLRSVTKSTAETELMSLSHTGGEMEWWNRAFTNVGFDPEIPCVLYCDNSTAVNIVNKKETRHRTTLKHVDIHQMWLCQEVEKDRLTIEWKPTSQMPADGLTKVLSRQKHEDFVRQLGLVNIQQMLKDRTIDGYDSPEPAQLVHWH